MYRLVIKTQQISSEQIALDAKQLHYLLRVVRLGNGDRFLALDGVGNCWLAELEQNIARIIAAVEVKTELPISLSLITALPKGSGYEQILRCCTELGVSNFCPVISDRTLLKPKPNKIERWRKIVTEAAEQSERQIVPNLSEPLKFSQAISQSKPNTPRYICVARGDISSLWQSLSDLTPTNISEITIATGCEGGWTNNEVQQASEIGFKPVSLGKRILRAVTAPIAVSSLTAAYLEQAERK
ncbi:MAG: 16S rRNA (uracil(1498)-N(3))-methyltransferase [Cyanobacteria bacterium J06623_7]